jgi:hypothetical protein
MLQKNLEDAVIVNYMLNESFLVPYGKDDITQLSASLNFNEWGVPSFEMSELIQDHVTYPDPAETFFF